MSPLTLAWLPSMTCLARISPSNSPEMRTDSAVTELTVGVSPSVSERQVMLPSTVP